jgi:hypothetical protein
MNTPGTKWTATEIALLREKYPSCSRTELQALFPGRTFSAIKCASKRYGAKKAIPRFFFTAEQTAYLRENYADTENTVLMEHLGCSLSRLYMKSAALGLKKSDSLIREQQRRISLTNHAFLKNSFRKGNIPLQKGKKVEEFMSPEGLIKFRATQFKPGNKSWKTKHDGAITVRRDTSGRKYKMIRISESQWELLHRHLWEQHYGAIPAGHNIVFRDGNSLNCTIENLECISNEELLERNRISSYPVELQTAIKTRNKIIKKIRNYGKKQN